MDLTNKKTGKGIETTIEERSLKNDLNYLRHFRKLILKRVN